MSLNVSSGGSNNFPITPEGVYIARCFKVIDIGTQWIEYLGNKKEQKKVLISWELLSPETVRMDDGKPFAATKQYTASLDERGYLRPDLEAWRGKKFTDTELESFDLKTVLGTYCQLQMVHSEDGKYCNVNSIMSTKEKPKGENLPVSFDIDNPDMELFETFSDKMKEKIQAAPEFRVATTPPPLLPSKPAQPDEVDIENIEEPIDLDQIPF